MVQEIKTIQMVVLEDEEEESPWSGLERIMAMQPNWLRDAPQPPWLHEQQPPQRSDGIDTALLDYLMLDPARASREIRSFLAREEPPLPEPPMEDEPVAPQPVTPVVAPATPPGALRNLPQPGDVERLVLSFLAPPPGLVFL